MIIKQSRYLFYLILFYHIRLILSNNSEQNFYQYLQQYGYTPKIEGRRLFSVVDKSTYTDAIKKFQRLYKLPVTY